MSLLLILVNTSRGYNVFSGIGLGSWDWRIRWCRESALNYFPVFKNPTYLFIDFGNRTKGKER